MARLDRHGAVLNVIVMAASLYRIMDGATCYARQMPQSNIGLICNEPVALRRSRIVDTPAHADDDAAT